MIEYLMEISFRKRTIILKALDILSDQDKIIKIRFTVVITSKLRLQ